MLPVEQLRAEFNEARTIVHEAWSEAEVLAALNRAETIALLAMGEAKCPPLPPDYIKIYPKEKWT